MAKSDMHDIARMLSGKHRLPQKDAEAFVAAFFETIGEGLGDDRQVKVKSLGTFKVVEVKERESVDVNTGERIKIYGRDKITFTPDSVMKDLVNKPFSQFETVVLNDGVDFSDLDVAAADDNYDEPEEEAPEASEAEQEKEPSPAEEHPVPEEFPAFEEPIIPEPSSVAEEISIIEASPVSEESPIIEASDVAEETPVIEEVSNPEAPVETGTGENLDDEEENPEKRCRKWLCILLAILLAVVTGAGMFFLGYNMGKKDALQTVKLVAAATSAQPQNTVKAEKPDSVAVKKAAVEQVVAEPQPAQSQAVTQSINNARRMVETGAYCIVGTSETVTVRKGQTLKGISKAFLGEGMECYVQIHNNVEDVQEGMKLRIPKLEIKKKKVRNGV